ncbi:50S ribosomal protein L35 [Thermosulfurimonas dismutans]|uniref:Large ribosomal subunit protein bL35 n=1 Tax=Thermosulfurimonas dismutans TaxID=999894 RepID=A0A179D5C1_9BACT|nr:50S ribosomal protein L35 [Thermosulfurimonas dismutans]OAQ21285.1 LSU ribosomal protein L35p [Thermosulfurimonas dismutans]HIE33055.1 50S ribosomal protein L35 [Thermodesulfobacteriaceae bacterium]
MGKKNKMKTNRSAAKRFKVTGSGKIVHFRACKSHLLRKKSAKRKRNLRKDKVLEGGYVKRVEKLIPYKF